MIADIQPQEVLADTLDKDIKYAIVQDAELAHVGGGNSVMSF